MFTIKRQLIGGVATVAIAGLTLVAPQAATAGVTATRSQAKQASKTMAAASPKTKAATTLAATGKIVQFDATAQSLTLSTSKGQEQFTLDTSTRLRDSSHTIAPADLTKLTGHQATVRYHDTAGQKSVVSVRVSSAAPKAQAKH